MTSRWPLYKACVWWFWSWENSSVKQQTLSRMTWLNIFISSWGWILSLSMSWLGTTAPSTPHLVWGGHSLPNRGTLLAAQPSTLQCQQSQTCAVCSTHQLPLSLGEEGLTVDSTVKSLRWCSVCINIHLQATCVELPQLSKQRWHWIALERMSPLVGGLYLQSPPTHVCQWWE